MKEIKFKSNLEEKVYDALKLGFFSSYRIQKEVCWKYLFPNIKTHLYDKIDFYLPDVNIIIEVNGIQHYQPTSFTKEEAYISTYDKQTRRDSYLRQLTKLHNYCLYEISYEKISKLNPQELSIQIENDLLVLLAGMKDE